MKHARNRKAPKPHLVLQPAFKVGAVEAFDRRIDEDIDEVLYPRGRKVAVLLHNPTYLIGNGVSRRHHPIVEYRKIAHRQPVNRRNQISLAVGNLVDHQINQQRLQAFGAHDDVETHAKSFAVVIFNFYRLCTGEFKNNEVAEIKHRQLLQSAQSFVHALKISGDIGIARIPGPRRPCKNAPTTFKHEARIGLREHTAEKATVVETCYGSICILI